MAKDAFQKARAPFDPKQRSWICVARSVGQDRKAMWGAYIGSDHVRDRLDESFGPDGWSFEIIGHQSDDLGNGEKMVTVFGRLKLGDVYRDDAGTDMVAMLGYDGKIRTDDKAWKSAVSRALVRCAAAFGIAAECKKIPFAYTQDPKTKPGFSPTLPGETGAHEGSRPASSPKSAGKGASSSSSSSGSSGVGAGSATDKQKDKLKELMQQVREIIGKRAGDDWLKQYAKDKGFKLNTLSVKDASEVITAVQEHLRDV